MVPCCLSVISPLPSNVYDSAPFCTQQCLSERPKWMLFVFTACFLSISPLFVQFIGFGRDGEHSSLADHTTSNMFKLSHKARKASSVALNSKSQQLEIDCRFVRDYYRFYRWRGYCVHFLWLACLHTPTFCFHSFFSHSSSLPQFRWRFTWLPEHCLSCEREIRSCC